MRWILVEATRPGAARGRRRPRRLRAARAARPRDRHPARDHARGGRRGLRQALDRRADPDADDRLDRRGRAAPEPDGALAAARRTAARSGSTSTCGSRASTASGRSATAPRCPTPTTTAPGRARRPLSTPSARGPRSPTTSPPSSGWQPRRAVSATAAKAAFVNLGRYKAVGKLGQLTVPRLPRLVDGADLPHEPDPGIARKIRAVADWTVGPAVRRDVAEVGSIGHPRPLGGRGLRARRHPPPARLAG